MSDVSRELWRPANQPPTISPTPRLLKFLAPACPPHPTLWGPVRSAIRTNTAADLPFVSSLLSSSPLPHDFSTIYVIFAAKVYRPSPRISCSARLPGTLRKLCVKKRACWKLGKREKKFGRIFHEYFKCGGLERNGL